MATTNTLMHAVLYLNYKNAGWSERYAIPTINYPDALTLAERLSRYRMAFVGQGVELVWARVSFAANPKESQGVEGLPLGPHAGVAAQDTPEDPFTALHYRFETAAGKFGSRLFRGVPDSVVANLVYNGIAPSPLAEGAALGNPFDPAANINYLQRSFLRWLIQNTLQTRRTLVGPPPQWETNPWTRCLFRRISKRDTGRPFGMFRGRAPAHS